MSSLVREMWIFQLNLGCKYLIITHILTHEDWCFWHLNSVKNTKHWRNEQLPYTECHGKVTFNLIVITVTQYRKEWWSFPTLTASFRSSHPNVRLAAVWIVWVCLTRPDQTGVIWACHILTCMCPKQNQTPWKPSELLSKGNLQVTIHVQWEWQDRLQSGLETILISFPCHPQYFFFKLTI